MKYHVITCSPESGEDDKQDVKTIKEAEKHAKGWIANCDGYYNSVKIFSRGVLVRRYINRNNKAIRVF
jgi:hypothetical protein